MEYYGSSPQNDKRAVCSVVLENIRTIEDGVVFVEQDIKMHLSNIIMSSKSLQEQLLEDTLEHGRNSYCVDLAQRMLPHITQCLPEMKDNMVLEVYKLNALLNYIFM